MRSTWSGSRPAPCWRPWSGSRSVRSAPTSCDGYKEGIADPRPHVLDRDCEWLRETLVVTEVSARISGRISTPAKIRKKAAKKKDAKLRPAGECAPATRRRSTPRGPTAASRSTISRGPPAPAAWDGRGLSVSVNGAAIRIIREAKAIVRSGWTLAHGGSHEPALRGHRYRDVPLARSVLSPGRQRPAAPLSPNDDKIEAKPKTPRPS